MGHQQWRRVGHQQQQLVLLPCTSPLLLLPCGGRLSLWLVAIGHHGQSRWWSVLLVCIGSTRESLLSLRPSLLPLLQPSCRCCCGCCGSVVTVVTAVVVAAIVAIIVAVVVASLLQSSRPYCHSRCGVVVTVVAAVLSWSSRPSLSRSVVLGGHGHRWSVNVSQ